MRIGLIYGQRPWSVEKSFPCSTSGLHTLSPSDSTPPGESVSISTLKGPIFINTPEVSPRLRIPLDGSQASHNKHIHQLPPGVHLPLVPQSQRCPHPFSCSKQRPGSQLDAPSPSPPSPSPVGSSSLSFLNSPSPTHCTPFYSPPPLILFPSVRPAHRAGEILPKLKPVTCTAAPKASRASCTFRLKLTCCYPAY